MSRPPKVSAALLRQQNRPPRQGIPRPEVSASEREGSLVTSAVARHPLGVLPNTLPEVWAAKAPSGGLWIMRESSDGPTCLAMIRPEDWQDIQASRKPVLLLPHTP